MPAATKLKGDWIIALLAPMVALAAMSMDIYLPSLPSIARDFAASPHAAQLTLSAFMYGYGAAQLVCGPLSDRFGRRPVLFGGLFLYLAATVGCLFAPSIEWLIALRFVQALGACVPPVMGRAIVRDVFAVEHMARAYSYIAIVFTAAPIVGPVVGGYLETAFGWRANFVLLTGIGAVLLAAGFALLGETNAHLNPHALRPSRLIGSYGGMLMSRRFLGYALTMGASFAGMFAFISEAPFVLTELIGLTPQWFGAAFAMVATGFGVGSFVCARLSPRCGINGAIAVGIAVYTVSALALNGLAFAGELGVLAICLPMIGISFAIGLIMPNVQAGGIAPFPTMAGSASALMGFLHTALSATTSIVVGRLHDGTQFPMTLAALVCAAALIALYFGLIRPQSRTG